MGQMQPYKLRPLGGCGAAKKDCNCGCSKQKKTMYFKPSHNSFRVRILLATERASNGNRRARKMVVRDNFQDFMRMDAGAQTANLMRNAREGEFQRDMRRKYRF